MIDNITDLRILFLLTILIAIYIYYKNPTLIVPLSLIVLINMYGFYLITSSMFCLFDECTLTGKFVSNGNYINIGSYLHKE